MTVSELKDLLEDFDDNDEIVIQVDSNNYWNHQIAKSIPDNAEYGKIGFSEYNRADRVLDEDSNQSDYTDVREVVILNHM